MKRSALITASIFFSILIFASFVQAACIEGNCVNGTGTMTFENGDKYVGEWKDSKQNGQGIMTFKSGNQYTGTWKDDLKDGQGVLIWVDSSVRQLSEQIQLVLDIRDFLYQCCFRK